MCERPVLNGNFLTVVGNCNCREDKWEKLEAGKVKNIWVNKLIESAMENIVQWISTTIRIKRENELLGLT